MRGAKLKKNRKNSASALVLLALVVILLGAITAYLGWPKLKHSSGDRINILLLGCGGDNHPGGNLTDSMEVASIDPIDKTVAMLAIPRDLYVNLESPVYAGRVNALYDLGDKETKADGGILVKQELSAILGVPINYYVRFDFSGFEKAVDAVDGIEVNVPKDLNDQYFPADDMINFEPFEIKAGERHMDGAMALKYARSRESTSDTDRAQRQQLILTAFAQKAFSMSGAANPKRWLSLLGVFGSSVRSDLKPDDAQTLAGILKTIDASKISRNALETSPNGPLISDSSSGIFYLKPKSGDWSEVQKISRSFLVDS